MILVTGATGTIGSELVPLLARRSAVRAMTRRPTFPGAVYGDLSQLGKQLVAVAAATSYAFGATWVLLNVTVVNPAASGFVTAYPAGATRPTITSRGAKAACSPPSTACCVTDSAACLTSISS